MNSRRLTLCRSRRAAVRWPGACGASLQRDALRRAVGTEGTRSGERQNVGRLASECSITESALSARAHPRRHCHGLLATAHALRWGSCGRVHVAREPPGAFSAPCKALTRDSRLGQRSWHARQRYSESVTLRFCHVMRAAQPRAAQTAAGTAYLPKRSAAKNQD